MPRPSGPSDDTPAAALGPAARLAATGQHAAAVVAATQCKPLRQSALFDTPMPLLAADAPALPAPNARDGQAALDPPRAQRHPRRILLAEHNLVNQKPALRLLQPLGCRADRAGLEAARRIIARGPAAERPRIVAMTANATQGERKQCLAAGMDDDRMKPIRVDALVQALNDVTMRKDA